MTRRKSIWSNNSDSILCRRRRKKTKSENFTLYTLRHNNPKCRFLVEDSEEQHKKSSKHNVASSIKRRKSKVGIKFKICFKPIRKSSSKIDKYQRSNTIKRYLKKLYRKRKNKSNSEPDYSLFVPENDSLLIHNNTANDNTDDTIAFLTDHIKPKNERNKKRKRYSSALKTAITDEFDKNKKTDNPKSTLLIKNSIVAANVTVKTTYDTLSVTDDTTNSKSQTLRQTDLNQSRSFRTQSYARHKNAIIQKSRRRLLKQKLEKEGSISSTVALLSTKTAHNTATLTVQTSTSVLQNSMSDDAKNLTNPATSLLRFSSSTLRNPKNMHKHFGREIKHSLSKEMPEEANVMLSPSHGTTTLSKGTKHIINTSKSAYRVTKLGIRGAKGTYRLGKATLKTAKNMKAAINAARSTLAAGKAIMLLIKAKKIASIVTTALPAVAKATVVVVKFLVKALKVIAGLIAAAVGVVPVVIVAVIVAIIAALFLIFSFVFSTVPNLNNYEMSRYVALVRELDNEVNNRIRQETYYAYEVHFINGTDDYDAPIHSRLLTNLHHFFALYLVYFNAEWDIAESNIRILHPLTYAFTITWDQTLIYYEIKDIAIVHLRVFSIEEMMGILGFDWEQMEFLFFVIDNRNLIEFFPDLSDYFFGENMQGLSPDEIAYVLDETPIAWPTHSRNISSPFGYRTLNGRRQFHNGIDIAVPIGTHVYASVGGRVTNSFYSTSGGHMIIIQNVEGIVTRYLHLDQRLVFYGDIIYIGDLIAFSGNTGYSTGPHLHYDIAINGRNINPLDLLP